jgi:hypothetical protein
VGSSSPDATVIFKTKGQIAAKVQGKIVKLVKKLEYDSVLSGEDSTGRQALKKLQFSAIGIKII